MTRRLRFAGRVLTGCALLLSVSASGQDFGGFTDDFLTDHEIDIIRDAQEPNERITHYLHFARLRLELVSQSLQKKEAGRSKLVHRNLNHYGRIIETIDMVIDDAAVDEADLTESMTLMAESEKEFLARLEAIQENPDDDVWAYEFVLEDAIDITRDSMELAVEDLEDRGRRILEAEAEEEEKRRVMMEPERVKEVDDVKEHADGSQKADGNEQAVGTEQAVGDQQPVEAERVAKKEAKPKSKAPTLLRPGEKIRKPGEPRQRR